nr:hypothetical protein BaRGS_024292 [Batillaria attramentaria]
MSGPTNPYPLVLHDLSIVFQVALIPLFCLVGMVGNILCALVFYRQGLRDRINMCLFCLAVADLMTLVPLFLLAFEAAYKTLVGELNFFVTYFVGLTGFTWVSMFLSAVIASERCLCVVSPFKAKQVLSTYTMAVFIVIVSAVLLGGMLAIAGPKHTSACVFDPVTNHTSTIVAVTKYYLDNQEILDIIDIFVYATAFPAFFIIVIIITTTITAAKLRNAATWRQTTASVYCTSASNPATTAATKAAGKRNSSAGLSRKEVAVTKMLIATSVLFVVCTLPSLMVQIAIFFVSELRFVMLEKGSGRQKTQI